MKELNRRGVLPIDITQNIKSFSQTKKHKKDGLTNDEVNVLNKIICSLPPSIKNLQLQAIYFLLAYQGLRQVEIIRLNFEDIDFLNGIALVQGKAMDDKEPVYLHPLTCSILRAYLLKSGIKSGAIFKSLGNRKSERITTLTIKNELRPLMKKYRINKSLHGFRHYFITTLLKNMDVRDVRKFSRHNSLDILIVYDDELNLKSKAQDVFTYFRID